jgi:hypothetical protein
MLYKLLTDDKLAAALGTGFKVRSIATLRRTGKIPVIRVGYRTLRYNLDAVLQALSRLQEDAIPRRRKRGKRRV